MPDDVRRDFATKRNARPPPTSLRFFVSPEPLHRAIVKNKKSAVHVRPPRARSRGTLSRATRCPALGRRRRRRWGDAHARAHDAAGTRTSRRRYFTARGGDPRGGTVTGRADGPHGRDARAGRRASSAEGRRGLPPRARHVPPRGRGGSGAAWRVGARAPRGAFGARRFCSIDSRRSPPERAALSRRPPPRHPSLTPRPPSPPPGRAPRPQSHRLRPQRHALRGLRRGRGVVRPPAREKPASRDVSNDAHRPPRIRGSDCAPSVRSPRPFTDVRHPSPPESRRPLHPAGTFAGALACMDENEDIPYDEVDAGVPLKPRAAWSAEEDARLARCARASRAGRSRPLASASPRESRVRFVSLGC